MSSGSYAGRIRTRGCALVVEEGSILLVKQQVPTRNHPIWLPPGGEILLGESARMAAIRETAEETGLIINPTRLAAVHEFIETPYHAIELYFFADVTGGELVTGTDPEFGDDNQQIMDVGFVPIKSLQSYTVSPSFISWDGLRNLQEKPDQPIRMFST